MDSKVDKNDLMNHKGPAGPYKMIPNLPYKYKDIGINQTIGPNI
jgi:hypothetical protein